MKCKCPLTGYCETHKLNLSPEQHRQCREDEGMYDSFRRLGLRKNMPGYASRAVSAAKATVRASKAKFQSHPVFITVDELEKRKAACLSCDKEADGWCGVCGCALAAKQRLATEVCPLGRWPTDNPPDEDEGPSVVP